MTLLVWGRLERITTTTMTRGWGSFAGGGQGLQQVNWCGQQAAQGHKCQDIQDIYGWTASFNCVRPMGEESKPRSWGCFCSNGANTGTKIHHLLPEVTSSRSTTIILQLLNNTGLPGGLVAEIKEAVMFLNYFVKAVIAAMQYRRKDVESLFYSVAAGSGE